jgi:hypothetical protein
MRKNGRLTRFCVRTVIALVIGLLSIARNANVMAQAQDQIYFSSTTNVTNLLVQYINRETVRLDISSWYLSEHSISIAIANRFNAGVPVRIIGDRAAPFENDPHTKTEYYWLASQGIPIRMRYNPTWFPEIDHWKAAIFVGQNVVEFGSGNFAPTELAPFSTTNYCDDSELFTSDPEIVNAFKTKFDVMWNDTTVEPNSIIGGPPYLKNWDDACATEPTGNCSDYRTLYPNPKPMIINTGRLEGDHPSPADMYWGQGTAFNARLAQEINNEPTMVDLIVYRLEVDNITQALISKHNAGVNVRVIVDPAQYTNNTWPEYWLTHANVDKLFAAGVPILQRTHAGVTHMKTLITSDYATNASSNFAPNWQRDHDYFVSAATKPTIYQAFVNQFESMWANTRDFAPFTPTRPAAATLSTPASGATNVPTSVTFTWNRASYTTSYDIYLGTSSANMTRVANVPAQLVVNPPTTYSWSTTLQPGTTYFWKVVSLTFATPIVPSMTATSTILSFTTAGSGGGGGSLPSPWVSQDVGSVGVVGSASFANNTFTVSGAGGDIWDRTDAFRYVYQPLSGDGQIVARVTAIQNTNANAKAGVMLRETTAAGSAHVILDVKPGGGIEFMTRPTTGATTTFLAGGTQAVPAWLKLARSGSTVTASVSANGTAWTVIGSTQVSIASSALVGLAVTSHDTTKLNTSTFDSVAVTGGSTPPPPPGAPASPSPANAATGVSTTPTLTWSSSGATSYDVAFGTANPPPQVQTGLTSASYSPSALTAGTKYFWQIIARNSAGSTSGAVWSFTTATSTPPNPNIVIYASDIPTTALHGAWTVASDATSPNGTKLSTPDAGFASTDTPLASPTHYVDVTFSAPAGTPYRLWLRLKAINNSKFNDSLWVQFSDARVNGNPIYAVSTTSGLDVNLATDATATSLNNWGWQNTAYWLSQSTTFTFAGSGTHTMRIQVREDGVEFDQIVLSPSQYLSSAPGGPTNDMTIVPKP